MADQIFTYEEYQFYPESPFYFTFATMSAPKHLSIEQFSYDLPEERIAKFPKEDRSNSNLLYYSPERTIETMIYRDLDKLIPAGSLMLFNNTKVVQARLEFYNPNGARIEVFCLEPADDIKDMAVAMAKKNEVEWNCLIGNNKKWKTGSLQAKSDHGTLLEITRTEVREGSFTVNFKWDHSEKSFSEILEEFGKTPLPPYIKRKAEEQDKDTYQTVYARFDGSVAAPTAGLHFTDELLNRLAQNGVDQDFVTLHVGAGTFKPVSADTMDGHDMHFELIRVNANAIKNIIRHLDRQIITVGTTSTRTVESLYWMGVKAFTKPDSTLDQLEVHQWDAYELPQDISTHEALEALLSFMVKHDMDEILSRTQLIIAPGYSFRIIDGLATNFHQPKSTLILLVAALIGEDWRKVYDRALAENFRFLSYGDGSLLMKPA